MLMATRGNPRASTEAKRRRNALWRQRAKEDPVKWARYLEQKRRWEHDNRQPDTRLYTEAQMNRRRFNARLRYHRERGNMSVVNAMLAMEVVVSRPPPVIAVKRRVVEPDAIFALVPKDGTVHRAAQVARQLRTTVAKLMEVVKQTDIRTMRVANRTLLYRL